MSLLIGLRQYLTHIQRLAIDPNSHNILYFGARSGHGLYKSTDYGVTWTQVKNFPSVGEGIPHVHL